MSAGELRDIKVKLSRKETELKDVKDILQQLYAKIDMKEIEITNLQRERDALRLKNEIMSEHIGKNNIEIDPAYEQAANEKLSLVEEYMQKLDRLQKELDKKSQEVQNKNKQIGELQAKKQIDDQLLNRQLEDIKKLKGQIKKYEENGSSLNPSPASSGKKMPDQRLRLNLHNTTLSTNGSSADPQKKLNLTIDAEGLNKKYIDSLSMQLDSIFSSNAMAQDEEGSIPSIPQTPSRSNKIPNSDDPSMFPQSSDDEMLTNGLEGEETVVPTAVIEEKEKFLTSIKSSVQQL